MDTGLIVDLETTGINPLKDKIIEIGILEFVVNDGVKPAIVGSYGALEDPGEALTPEIMKITGLNDDVLFGRHIDWDLVKTMFGRASILIAHNAKFDAAFIQNRPEMAGIECHWGCSMKHIPWHKLGFRTTALNYLAADHGFVNPFAHRALFDCATTFRLLEPYLGQLIQRSYEREFMLQAVGSPFETKDKLKAKGYHWDPAQRVWLKNVLECDLEEERQFLKSEIYAGASYHQEQLIS